MSVTAMTAYGQRVRRLPVSVSAPKWELMWVWVEEPLSLSVRGRQRRQPVLSGKA